MEKKKNKTISFIVPIVLVFCIIAVVVFSIAGKISVQMSESAVNNLSETLDLVKGTIEAILEKEAEFQKLISEELATMEDPEDFVKNYNKSRTMVRMSLIPSGQTQGISNVDDIFTEEGLDFSYGNTVDGLPISQSYLNTMGTWAYTIKSPVVKDGREIATLYIEYIYESFDDSLPGSFYNSTAMLYIMDAHSSRFVLKPKGIGERAAGHLNLEDFYRANNILEEDVQAEIAESIENGKDVMFYHDIRGKESLIYMWAVNEGAVYLIGYVPVEAIQREGTAVNQNILIVVVVMLAAFFCCCILYYAEERQQKKIREERERERELHNQQLADALQAAEIANHSKTIFLSNMSHDIRTPMNAILGFTTLLARDADNPGKVREYTQKVTASGQHLLGLINDVLDVSKIESGKVVLTVAEFTLSNMLASVDAIIRPEAKAKGQNFDVSVTGLRHDHLIGDETRLNQILINLLSNAVKYTQEGGTIWFRIIGLEQRSSQYEHIRIEVEDNGFGMTPDYLKVIFDAFTREENSTTNKIQGTGLGMAITKNIVELMGGTIEVASEVDKGSLFTVELELRISDMEADREFWKNEGILRILAVDDAEDVCQNIQMLMEDTGVHVDTAGCGEDAVHLVLDSWEQENPYQVILLDWKMPGMNGMETARQIRSLFPEPVLILFLTACDWDVIKDEAVSVEPAGFLAKPFFVSDLREKILETRREQERNEQAAEVPDDNGLEGRHFLVAEDNEINAEILAELLEMEGATCEIMVNGQLVYEHFINTAPESFDAILMDVQMPVMNGYDATKAIRAFDREDAKTIPIIAMTANAFAEDVKDALDAGMNAHVAKPIDMEILKKAVNQFLII